MLRRTGLWIGVVTLLFAGGCSSDDSQDFSRIACSYESRSTDCSGTEFGEWFVGCVNFTEATLLPDVTAPEACTDFTQDGIECEGTCCVDTEFRNVSATPGECP